MALLAVAQSRPEHHSQRPGVGLLEESLIAERAGPLHSLGGARCHKPWRSRPKVLQVLGVPGLKVSMSVRAPVLASHNIVTPVALPVILSLGGAPLEQAASGVVARSGRVLNLRRHAVLQRVSGRARSRGPGSRAVTVIHRAGRNRGSSRRWIKEGANARSAGRGANTGPLGPKLHRGGRQRRQPKHRPKSWSRGPQKKGRPPQRQQGQQQKVRQRVERNPGRLPQ